MSQAPLSEREAGGSVYRHMLRGASWAVAMNWVMRGIGVVNTVILARLLLPEHFGLVAMASLLYGFLDTFFDLGTGAHLIRQQQASPEHCNTAWTIGVLRGLVVGLILAAAAPLAAKYFHEERVVALCYFVALNSALNGAISIGIVLLRKELKFERDFQYMVCTRLFTFFATLALAYALRNYWALVFGQLAGSLFALWFSFWIHPYRPRFDLSKAREYIKFSAVIVPLNVVFYLNQRADVFVVGRIAPTATLGVYNVASELSAILTFGLMLQVGRGLYPSYASMAHEPAKLSTAYLNSLSGLNIVSVALGLGLFAVSQDFVVTVLGEKWHEVIPLLQWRTLSGLAKAIAQNIGGGVLIAVGKEKLAAAISLARLVTLCVAAALGARVAEVEGIAVGVTISSVLMIPVVGYFVASALRVSRAALLSTLWRPLLAGMAMVFVVRFCRIAVLEPWKGLLLGASVGTIVFLVTLTVLWFLSGRPRSGEWVLLEALRHKLGRRAEEVRGRRSRRIDDEAS